MLNEKFHLLVRASAGTIALTIAAALAVVITTTPAPAQDRGQAGALIKDRNLDASRGSAADRPRKEADQALAGGWPLYRTDRGQEAFNDAMATLKATDGPAPDVAAFKGCADLQCKLDLPKIGSDGWIPAGRIWVSPTQYVLFVRSDRKKRGRSYSRRSFRSMKYFVYHEFHNSTRNTDTYDTISSHSGSVFVPFYLSKQGMDAQGRRFVVIMQIAPYDVRSVHASNKGSAGPGVEVAKNYTDMLQSLQGQAGVLLGTIIKNAAPHLQVVNHRGNEGLPMLRAYRRQVAAAGSGSAALTLPFVPATAQRVASASGGLKDLIIRSGVSPRLPIAQRTFMPRKRLAETSPPREPRPVAKPAPVASAAPSSAAAVAPAAVPMSPLAAYLRANLLTMKRDPGFAAFIPEAAAGIGEVPTAPGVVYLLDSGERILGHIKPRQSHGAEVAGQYVFVPVDRAIGTKGPFDLDLSIPLSGRSAVLKPAIHGTRKWQLKQRPVPAAPPTKFDKI